jgi:hypothetical protein
MLCEVCGSGVEIPDRVQNWWDLHQQHDAAQKADAAKQIQEQRDRDLAEAERLKNKWK